ncbi:type VI secretion system-associated lipoprotein [Helicobacter pullorum]|uniref:type VI secretion system lipoprotein TssJ n=1 Tax=Campylobacterales TaxID=213849 RepID=UPI0006BB176A|nr:type VI secretion system lipoprotein TssJ [Helicobacter pullorum]EAI7507839.1 type VI secretion system lipoprotein TssJ [Campylobacter coli]EAK6386334.1 type VI secretion system lipoprotein TssJ [Campylobacter coli]ECQ5494686.1 type VI secretion system lipoprotein TssJ [Campylobacter coli]EDO9587999.1 type VI secretion system lipoprotein TssJ [Campylobacter coli]EFS2167833.1 type VI secretion system lipoprotein TssJ [Campylobacter coli]
MNKKILAFFLALQIMFFLGACSNTVNVKIDNIENSNLNNRMDDVPLTIMVYQLKDIKKFEEANDTDLLTRDDSVLGKDKIDSIKLQIAPKVNVVAVKVDEEEVPYIGVLAIFANKMNKNNKIWIETSKAYGIFGDKTLHFKITKEGISFIDKKEVNRERNGR